MRRVHLIDVYNSTKEEKTGKKKKPHCVFAKSLRDKKRVLRHFCACVRMLPMLRICVYVIVDNTCRVHHMLLYRT